MLDETSQAPRMVADSERSSLFVLLDFMAGRD
jgi:hypothetical protein